MLLSLFERKNPHLFEERIVEGLTMEDLDSDTFQYCRNILAVIKPNHHWLQLTDEDILLHARPAKKERESEKLNLIPKCQSKPRISWKQKRRLLETVEIIKT